MVPVQSGAPSSGHRPRHKVLPTFPGVRCVARIVGTASGWQGAGWPLACPKCQSGSGLRHSGTVGLVAFVTSTSCDSCTDVNRIAARAPRAHCRAARHPLANQSCSAPTSRSPRRTPGTLSPQQGPARAALCLGPHTPSAELTAGPRACGPGHRPRHSAVLPRDRRPGPTRVVPRGRPPGGRSSPGHRSSQAACIAQIGLRKLLEHEACSAEGRDRPGQSQAQLSPEGNGAVDSGQLSPPLATTSDLAYSKST